MTGAAGGQPDAARLSRLLFEAREIADMYRDIVQVQTGQVDTWITRVRDQIDDFRAEQGWNPDGFGGES